MPISKHRQKPPIGKRRLEMYAQMERDKTARREIYKRALPKYQEYPPVLLKDIHNRPPRELQADGSHVAQLYSQAEHKSFQTFDKRNYEFQVDGSLRVLNKPRSRVKRLREVS